MNERIKELIKQATIIEDDELFVREVFDREKFAELIVKQTIHEMTAQMFYYGIDEANNPSFYKAIDKTKQHFGVES